MLYPTKTSIRKKKTDHLDDAVNDEHDPVLQFVMSYPILQHFLPQKNIAEACYSKDMLLAFLNVNV